VLKQYHKWQAFDENYKNVAKEYEKAFERKRDALVELKKTFDATVENDKRDQLQAQMKQVERETQDLSEQAKKQLGKYREDNAVQIYKEVQAAVERYARSHDIGLVMHYADATTPAEIFHPMNIMHKLQTQACIPMYIDAELDITGPVGDMLNQAIGVPASPGTQR